MIFPGGRRRNSRYRGPIESKKIDNFYTEVIKNIETLYETFSQHESTLLDIKASLNDEIRREPAQKLIKMNDTIEYIKGGK